MPRALDTRLTMLERLAVRLGACDCLGVVYPEEAIQDGYAAPTPPLCPHGRAWSRTVRVVYDDYPLP